MMIPHLLSSSSICRQDSSKCYRRSGSLLGNIVSANSGSREWRAIRNHTGYVGNVLGPEFFCSKKMAAGWPIGWSVPYSLIQ